MMKTSIQAVFSAVVLTTLLSDALSCRCFPPTIEGDYHKSEFLVTAKVLGAFGTTENNYYHLSVEKTYKGCNFPSKIVTSAYTNSATCAIALNVGQTYVLPFYNAKSFQKIGSCQVCHKNESQSKK